MSFYTDDFYQDSAADEDAFLCINCGGTDSYMDNTTGLLCCSSCFTQSQATQPDVLDVDEVQGLAARTRGGHFKSATRRKLKGPRKKQPLSQLDTSVPFPSLIACLHGMQRILQQGSDVLCDLAGIVQEKQREVVKKIVHDLWRGYLVAWSDGAEYYGKLHPEVRFSLRDAFVTRQYKNLVIKHLSYACMEALKKEEEESKEQSTGCEYSGINNENDVDVAASQSPADVDGKQQTEHDNSTESYYKYQHNYSKIIPLLKLYGKKGRKEAALRLQPTITLCASILWLSVSRAGVTCLHVCSWIANGSLPLLNAFHQMLDEKERQALRPIANVFQLQNVPSTRLIEFQAELLVVACGLKSPRHSVKSNGVVSKNREEKRKHSQVHPDSVALLAARFVSDLGLGQVVLDTALALMGLAEANNDRLPPCLDAARPEKLVSPAHVLGVICVACKMCRKWESWAYQRPTSGRKQKRTDECNLKNGDIIDDQTRSDDDSAANKRRRINKEMRDRFVPWNEQQFRLVGNGPMVEGYLDFLEDVYLGQAEEITEFHDILSSSGESVEKKKEPSSQSLVRPSPVLAGGRNPNRPRNSVRRQLHRVGDVKRKRQRPVWADANRVNEYIVYADGKDTRPFHPHYKLLLEYMAYKTGVEPSEIHKVVSKLDGQLAAYFASEPPLEPSKKSRKDKRIARKRKTYTIPSDGDEKSKSEQSTRN